MEQDEERIASSRQLLVVTTPCDFAHTSGIIRSTSPSPRLRGEGRGEGEFHAFGRAESPPHPKPSGFDLSPQAGRGANTRASAISPRDPRELCIE